MHWHWQLVFTGRGAAVVLFSDRNTFQLCFSLQHAFWPFMEFLSESRIRVPSILAHYFRCQRSFFPLYSSEFSIRLSNAVKPGEKNNVVNTITSSHSTSPQLFHHTRAQYYTVHRHTREKLFSIDFYQFFRKRIENKKTEFRNQSVDILCIFFLALFAGHCDVSMHRWCWCWSEHCFMFASVLRTIYCVSLVNRWIIVKR